MFESWITLQGWVGGDVTVREAGTTTVATFRLGCTPRYVRNGLWVDGQTSWYTVSAWRSLADHVAESVHKGDAVVVYGKMRTDVWEREGQPPSITHVVDASFVGHDLNRGTATFTRAVRKDRPDADTTVLREMVHTPAETPQLDADGRPREAPAA